jgi:hypothetical protein
MFRIKSGLISWIPSLWCAWQMEAQPAVYEATGSQEQIQSVMDQFKHDIVFGPGGDQQHPPPQLGSYRVATLDDVNETEVSNLSSGGLVIGAGPGALLEVRASQAAFSPPNVLTMRTLTGPVSQFFSTTEPVTSSGKFPLENAFGAVFADVNSTSSARLEFLSGVYNVPITTAPGTYSFVGVIQRGAASSGGFIYLAGLPGSPPDSSLSGVVSVDEIIL